MNESLPRPTLLVHTTCFPSQDSDRECKGAETLGKALYKLLTRDPQRPLHWGAGVPVRVATQFDHIDLGEAEHVVIVAVLGQASHADENLRKRALAALHNWCERGVCVMPLLMHEGWRHSAELQRMQVQPLLTELDKPDPQQRTTLAEIVLQLSRVLSGKDSKQGRLFIAYAKADLQDTGNAADLIHRHVMMSGTGMAFFDEVSLLAGENLTEQIESACSQGMFVMVRGDGCSTSHGCQAVLLQAKRARRPILMVEALANGEGRSLAYGGNSPTEVWHRSQEDDSAARVALRAMVECLRHALFHREAKRIIESIGFGPHTIVPMSRPPELLDLPILRAEERVAAGCPLVILHPDPQLNVQEQNVLFNHDRNLKLLTPATALAGAFSHSGHVPLDRWRVGMSLADSPDADGPEGYMQEHVRDITVSLARTLVASGAALAYGGDFRSGGYTEILSKLVEGWNRTARRPVDLLHCYIAAHCDPLHGEKLVFTAHHLAQASGLGQSALLSPPTAKDVPAHRCSLYVSEMRKVMEHELQARVLIGGNTRPRSLGQTPQEGYGGRFPGIVEEAWQSLRHNTPLYVIGGFGGATALVAQLLSGTEERVPEALCERSWQHESWRCLSAAHDADPDARKLGLPRSLDALASAVRELGRRHLACDEAAQAWNGLTCAENRQLFCSRDTITIAALVLKGLLQRRAHQTDRQLKIELVPGDIACASGLDVIAFPVFSDMELQGAGAALDAASSGAATDSQRSGGLVANRGERVGTGFLYAADLGSVNEALANPEPTVQRAAQRTAAVVRRYGFGQVGIVAFLGNTLEQIEQVVAPMLSGLRTLSDVSIAWFERDAKRFAALEKLLGERSDVTLSTRAPTQPAASSPTPRERTYVPVRQLQREELEVAVLMPHSNGLWPSTPRTLTLEERQELVGPQNARAPEARELNRRGQRMLEILFGADPVEVLNPLHANELVIAHDAEAAGLPYEALCWRDPVTDCWVRPAAKLGIVRRLKAPGIPLRCGANRPPSNHLKVLLVVNPTGNLKGADHEAADILRSLASVDIKPAVLRHDQATVAGVCQALNQEAVDVLHYCGHAFFEGEGPGESGLYCADGPLTHEHLRALPPANMPRLAFVNGCQGGRVRSTAPAASSEAQAFAEFFLRGGVDAYLGTFWVLSDPGASMFAKTVYRALIDGSELGAAVIAGRQVLIENGNPDWANYVLYGDSGFRLLRPASAGGEHAHH